MLGRSSVGVGVDADVLSERAGAGEEWVTLFGAGGNVTEIVNTATLLSFLEQPPRVVVIGMHAFNMAEEACLSDEARRELEGARTWSGEMSKTEASLVLVAKRASFRELFGSIAFKLRRGLWWGLLREPASVFSPPADLTAVFPEFKELVGPDSRARRIESDFECAGFFRESCYARSSRRQQSLLLSLLDSFRGSGTTAAVVLMPERSDVRDKTPEIAARLVEDVASSSSASFWDARAALDDGLFYDQTHLNRLGRRAFSDLFGERFRGSPRATVSR